MRRLFLLCGVLGLIVAAVPAQAATSAAISEWFWGESEQSVPPPTQRGSAPDATAVVLPSPVPAVSKDDYASLAVGELHLEMDATEAEILFRKPPSDRSSFPLRIVEDGRRLDGRVSVRGNFSRNFLKKSLLITLPKGSEWQGQRRLSLTALATDPSRMRDWLAWRLIHDLGMVAPRVQFLNLTLNGQFLGLYLQVEWIDERVFDRYGLGTAGEFYQPDDQTYCGDFTEVQLPRFDQCWEKLSPRDGDVSRLRALNEEILATPIDRFDAFVAERFDARALIDWLVVVALTSSGDTYHKNYFLRWNQGNGKWTVIPWDFDQSFGRVGDEAALYPLSVWNDHFVYYYPPDLGAQNVLKEKTLRNPRLYARYKARIAELLAPGPCDRLDGCPGAAGWFHPSRFSRLIDQLRPVVEPRAEKFPPVQSGGRYEHHVDSLKVYNEWRYHYLYKLVLEPTVFDTPLWLPYSAYAPLNPLAPGEVPVRRRFPITMIATREQPAGDARAFYLDTWMARPLAAITTRAVATPVRLTVEVSTETPPELHPETVPVQDCLERTWFVSVKSPGRRVSARLELDWLQESSTHHELGTGVRDEEKLTLWAHDGTRWWALASRVNPIANQIVADEVPLDAARPLRLIACGGTS